MRHRRLEPYFPLSSIMSSLREGSALVPTDKGYRRVCELHSPAPHSAHRAFERAFDIFCGVLPVPWRFQMHVVPLQHSVK